MVHLLPSIFFIQSSHFDIRSFFFPIFCLVSTTFFHPLLPSFYLLFCLQYSFSCFFSSICYLFSSISYIYLLFSIFYPPFLRLYLLTSIGFHSGSPKRIPPHRRLQFNKEGRWLWSVIAMKEKLNIHV